MKRSSFSIQFFIRDSRIKKDGSVTIEVSLTINGQRSFFSTGKNILATNWDKVKQIAKGKSEESQNINNFLQALKNRLHEKEVELMERGYIVTAELLRDSHFNKVESLKERTLIDVFIEHNSNQEKNIGNGVSKATHWISVYTLRLVKEYLAQKYERNDIYLKELNIGFIQSFHTFLKKDRGMAQNSATKHLKLLKKIVNIAVANSYITFNPFITYKIEREPVEIDFLDEEELRRIINFDTPLPRLERAKDMFLFGCFTGLSYIDIKTLAPEHFEKDGTGRIWIKNRRVKTGVLSRIPLLPIAKLILDKYKGGEKLLPIQDPADINKYLKDIAILCDIKKRLTFHLARHSYLYFPLRTNDLRNYNLRQVTI